MVIARVAAVIPRLSLGIRPLMNGLGFRDEFGKRHGQRHGQFFGDIQAGIAQRTLQHSDVGKASCRAGVKRRRVGGSV